MRLINSATNVYAESIEAMGFRLLPINGNELARMIENDGDRTTISMYAEDLGKLIKTHIYNTKNVVIPLIEKVKNFLEEQKKLAESKPLEESFNIVQMNIPEPILTTTIVDEIKEYSNQSILRPQSYLPPIIINEETIRDMAANNSFVEKELVKWAVFKETEKLKQVISGFFSTDVSNKQYFLDDIEKINPYERIEMMLMIYMVSCYLEANTQTTNLSLNDYNSTLFQYKKYAMTTMAQDIDNIHDRINNNLLIIRNDTIRNTVYVDAVLYKDWVETGGTAETILGAMLSNDNYSDKDRLSSNSEKYKTMFETRCNLSKIRDDNSLHELIISAAKAAYDNIEVTELEKAYSAKKMPTCVEKGREKLYNELRYITQKEAKDLYELAAIIVAKSRFYYTPSYSIYSDINRLGNENSSIEVREASLLAAINYATDYVYTLMRVEKI